jgi:hypothetical protein
MQACRQVVECCRENEEASTVFICVFLVGDRTRTQHSTREVRVL